MSDPIPCSGPISATFSGFVDFFTLSQIQLTVTYTVAKLTWIFLAEDSAILRTRNKLDISWISHEILKTRVKIEKT